MKIRHSHAATLLIAALFGCQDSNSASLETDDQKASYAIGLDIGRNLMTVESHIDLAALRVGIEDALAESEQRISQEELDEVMVAFGETIQAESLAEMEAESARNLEEGAAYLAENGAREGVTTTDTGLQYEVLREGDGARPEATSRATIHYRGTLVDGTEFDSSYERDEPAVFPLNGVIPGFSEGLQLMQIGSQYRFVMPADVAYGAAGSPPSIGPNATLIFEVELLEISP
jgi:FKBP-type peptidyl-prolyl cis-trans isomerase